ncbi:MAG: hypothetical protein HQ508_08500 [Candidatus Marinimicrobia bacterium]|nr:hypothetical protein [Candidatus Neomarinimicrobiota bacterium]
MNKKFIISTLLCLGFALPLMSQTPQVYWGLNWSMTAEQVDSTLRGVFKEKKVATKTNYVDNRQLSGYSYNISEKGIAKIYIWYNVSGTEKVSIQSIEVLYSFDYPYDAQRFKQAYFERYGHVFEEKPEPYLVEGGGSVLLRIVKEPDPGTLGQTLFQLSMLSTIPFKMTEENMDFLF